MGLDTLCEPRERAEWQAWEALAEGNFKSFGFWAEVWINENKSVSKLLQIKPKRNPWQSFINIARSEKRILEGGLKNE